MNHNLQTNLPTNDDSTQNIFKALLQLGIGTRTSLTFPHPIPPKIWYQVMNIARKARSIEIIPTRMPQSWVMRRSAHDNSVRYGIEISR